MIVVVVLGFYVPPTAKVILRRDIGLKSHPKDCRSLGSNSRLLLYKASSLTTTPRRLLSRHEKTGICICENKGADQLCSNCTADQRLCFRYIDSDILLLPKSKISSL